ncbi:MAG: glycine cleavage system aminomethyltransferase GcvT [Cyanobacteriota bacterium]|jgi:aminomethyltransferase
MTSPNAPLRTPLFDLIQKQGAKFTSFAGWEMPIQFTSLQQEHQAVRHSAGLFDISHMGKFTVEGEGVLASLQGLVPSDLSRLAPGLAQYTVLLNEQGGILDDIIIYSQSPNRAVLIVNAATRAQDWDWFQSHLPALQWQDLSGDKVLLALQGPQALGLLQSLLEINLETLPRFGHLQTELAGETLFIARTGYTGEDGAEIMVSPAGGRRLWTRLLELGAVPCGLGARDTLRLEAAMALYGQDLTPNTTPLEAGLGWVVQLQSGADFIGRSALLAQKEGGVPRKLVGLQMQDRAIPRHGYPIYSGAELVGEVASGTLSPTLGIPIALGYVPSAVSAVGQALDIEVRGKRHPAKVVKKPFYRRSS